MNTPRVIRLNDQDNVVIRGLIPPGHKVATRDIALGDPVRRYNQIIGFATRPIRRGARWSRSNATTDEPPVPIVYV